MLKSFTLKLGQKPHRAAKARLNDVFDTAINGLDNVLQLIPTSVGPPGRHTGLKGLLFILCAIQVGNLCSETLPISTTILENSSKCK